MKNLSDMCSQMTLEGGGGGGFAEDDVIFYNHFWPVLLLNLDESESEFQKYIKVEFDCYHNILNTFNFNKYCVITGSRQH